MRFTAVLRAQARSNVRRTDPPLVVLNFPSSVGVLTIVIRTRYDEKELGIPVPRELWVEARGDAPSLEEGLKVAWGAAASVLPVIARMGSLRSSLGLTGVDDARTPLLGARCI
jgi:hypothetical protein